MSELKDKLDELKKRLKDIKCKQIDLRNQEWAIQKHIDDISEKVLESGELVAYDPLKHSIGNWECETSPIGVCVYDSEEDPCWDSCIFCGEPDERK